jgi:hypothetical protein
MNFKLKEKLAAKIKENKGLSLVSDVLSGKEGRLAQGLGIVTAAFTCLMLSAVAASAAGMAIALAAGNIAAYGSAALSTAGMIGIGAVDIAALSVFTATLAKKDGRVKAEINALEQSLKAKLSPYTEKGKRKAKAQIRKGKHKAEAQVRKSKKISAVLDVLSGKKGKDAENNGHIAALSAAMIPIGVGAGLVAAPGFVPILTALGAFNVAAYGLSAVNDARKHDGLPTVGATARQAVKKKTAQLKA